MEIFSNLICAATTVSLCLFLIRSRVALSLHLAGKTVAALAGSWLFLSIVSLCLPAVPVRTLSAAIAAGYLHWHLGQASPQKALYFGLVFGLLRLISSAAPLLMRDLFLNAAASGALLESAVMYALTVFAAAISDRWRSVRTPLLQLIPVWLVTILLCEEVIRNRSFDSVVILQVLAFLWLLYAGILLHQVGSKLEDKLRHQLETQQKAHHYALQEEYYQQLRRKQTETRALWHDLNKYLRAAKAESPSAQALEQLEAMLGSATEIVDVGNPILNVILNEYAQLAKPSGIELRLKVQVPERLPISVADLYILIGNTMDNALEACLALPGNQRLIDLTLRTHNDVLYYKLVNPYDATLSSRDQDPMRGHGLNNVNQCVKRYGGFASWTKENGYFTVTAHINL